MTSLSNNISEVLRNYDELEKIAKPTEEKDNNQLEINFGENNGKNK